jgi:hypothetical protein
MDVYTNFIHKYKTGTVCGWVEAEEKRVKEEGKR